MLAEHKTLGEKHKELSQLQAEQEKELQEQGCFEETRW